jgi:hypothetical protein
MRNILYICTKNQYDWDILIPQQPSSPTEMDISVLLLQDAIGLSNIPISQPFALNTDGGEKDGFCKYVAISYQDFLDKIFLTDLALVM